ncbi:MAG: HAD family hydrolase [Candidatus Omnitrophica bacterium]|nr:HAD family hydrolase [Candidatus Omnitrophota bacterium]
MIKALLMDFGDTIVVEEEGKRLSDMALCPVPGVRDFLEEFSRLPIVIVSNTIHSNSRDIRQLVRQLGLNQYIHSITTSMDCGAAKPDPRIFHSALEPLGVRAAESVMIGDRMDVDIEGARRAGIKSIHLFWRARHEKKRPSCDIQPDARVENYEELSRVLRGWLSARH